VKEPIGLESLFPDRSSGEPLGAQLVRRLRAAIASGFFPAASRLLPSRELASRLGLSRNTVTSALDQLIAEGYLQSRIGAGTFVTDRLHESRPRAATATQRQLPVSSKQLDEIRIKLEAVGSSFGPLRVGAPDLAAFPLRTWRRLERENLTCVDAHLDYGQSSGLLALRQAISRHIAQFRGVVAEPDQIVIVEGSQGALHLIAFVLAQCGDTAAVEDPCYQMASTIFAAHGLVLRGIPVDRDGMRTSELPSNCALAYVSPSHQFPLGGAMPLARRSELLQWAVRSDAYVVEDDYDSEFATHPFPALQSLDGDERVIYVGTFSKTLAPGLRLGYVVAPPHLAKTFRFTRAITSLGAPAHLQKTIADFIDQGYFSRHIRRMTPTYERRRNIVVDTLRKHLPHDFTIGPAQTGLHVAIAGPAGFDDVRAVDRLEEGRVLPLSPLCVERTDCRGFVVGFSAGSEERIAHAAAALAQSLPAAPVT
jgi:GntR family transcriptional regulator/MocR family aminotransferase